MVGFLSNDDPAAKMYAEWTGRTCKESGILFELREIPRTELEDRIVEANEDLTVHGIIVYYPVFGGSQVKYIQLLDLERFEIQYFSCLPVSNL